jgi:hypothetical protein
MKQLLIALLISSFTTISAQTKQNINNFHFEQSEICWRKVMNTTLSCDEIFTKAKESGLFDRIEKDGNKLMGELKPLNADWIGAGYTFMSAPSSVQSNFISGFVLIEVKDGRYRVTIKKMMVMQKSIDSLNISGSKKYLEEEAMKRGKYEYSLEFTQKSSAIWDHTFSHKLNFNIVDNDVTW